MGITRIFLYTSTRGSIISHLSNWQNPYTFDSETRSVREAFIPFSRRRWLIAGNKEYSSHVISMSHNICYVYFWRASSFNNTLAENRLNHSPLFNLAKKSKSTGKIPSKRTGIGNGEQIRFTMNDTMAPCKFSFSVGKNDKEEWNNVILGANSPALFSIPIFLTDKQNRNLICIYLIVCTENPPLLSVLSSDFSANRILKYPFLINNAFSTSNPWDTLRKCGWMDKFPELSGLQISNDDQSGYNCIVNDCWFTLPFPILYRSC